MVLELGKATVTTHSWKTATIMEGMYRNTMTVERFSVLWPNTGHTIHESHDRGIQKHDLVMMRKIQRQKMRQTLAPDCTQSASLRGGNTFSLLSVLSSKPWRSCDNSIRCQSFISPVSSGESALEPGVPEVALVCFPDDSCERKDSHTAPVYTQVDCQERPEGEDDDDDDDDYLQFC